MALTPATKVTLQKVQQEFNNYNFFIATEFGTFDTRKFVSADYAGSGATETLTLNYVTDKSKQVTIKPKQVLSITVISTRNFLKNQ